MTSMVSRIIKKTSNSDLKQYYIVRVNGDNFDTYADEDEDVALEMANLDEDDKYEMRQVQAPDAGAARLMWDKGDGKIWMSHLKGSKTAQGRRFNDDEWKEFILEGDFEGEYQTIREGGEDYNVPKEDCEDAAEYVQQESDVFDSRIKWEGINAETEKYETALTNAVGEWIENNPGALEDEYGEEDLSDDAALIDVYFTLSEAGVGIWDGRWDHFFTDEKYVKEIESYLKKKLSGFVDSSQSGSLEEEFFSAVYEYFQLLIKDYLEDLEDESA